MNTVHASSLTSYKINQSHKQNKYLASQESGKSAKSQKVRLRKTENVDQVTENVPKSVKMKNRQSKVLIALSESEVQNKDPFAGYNISAETFSDPGYANFRKPKYSGWLEEYVRPICLHHQHKNNPIQFLNNISNN